MKESVTYQAIVEEGRQEGLQMGRAEEARRLLLRQGNKRFGPPSGAVQSLLEGMTTLEALESLSDRILDVESWTELLAMQ